jgi:hypothetical protein
LLTVLPHAFPPARGGKDTRDALAIFWLGEAGLRPRPESNFWTPKSSIKAHVLEIALGEKALGEEEAKPRSSIMADGPDGTDGLAKSSDVADCVKGEACGFLAGGVTAGSAPIGDEGRGRLQSPSLGEPSALSTSFGFRPPSGLGSLGGSIAFCTKA